MIRLVVLAAATIIAGCGDDGQSGASASSGVDGPGSDADADADAAGESTGDTAIDPENFVRGRFVPISGQDVVFESSAAYDTTEFGGASLASCANTGAGSYALGINYQPAATMIGTVDALDLTNGPYVVLGWPQADGTGLHGTATANGTLTLTEFETEIGGIVAGTAAVMLSPEAGDPNDLFMAVEDIEFRCVVK